MVYCSVACCKNGNHNRPELAYFTFPSDKRLGAWLNFCRRADKKFAEERSKAKARKANNLRICSAHFAPEAYKKTLNGKRIPYDTALPTIFQPNTEDNSRRSILYETVKRKRQHQFRDENNTRDFNHQEREPERRHRNRGKTGTRTRFRHAFKSS